ncbi:hypothetical protein C8Q76DRAFT_856269 [Earliella scabrosa]|nr:hypothetical protein C8Q76DRAFT_856269 [Earliella scabrosa]
MNRIPIPLSESAYICRFRAREQLHEYSTGPTQRRPIPNATTKATPIRVMAAETLFEGSEVATSINHSLHLLSTAEPLIIHTLAASCCEFSSMRRRLFRPWPAIDTPGIRSASNDLVQCAWELSWTHCPSILSHVPHPFPSIASQRMRSMPAWETTCCAFLRSSSDGGGGREGRVANGVEVDLRLWQ